MPAKRRTQSPSCTFERRVRTRLTAPIAAIADWPWPGNVRELENRMKRAVIMAEGSRLTAADLDLVNSSDEAALTLKVARETADRQAIRRAMLRADGNVSTAAKFLGVSRPTL